MYCFNPIGRFTTLCLQRVHICRLLGIERVHKGNNSSEQTSDSLCNESLLSFRLFKMIPFLKIKKRMSDQDALRKKISRTSWVYMVLRHLQYWISLSHPLRDDVSSDFEWANRNANPFCFNMNRLMNVTRLGYRLGSTKVSLSYKT